MTMRVAQIAITLLTDTGFSARAATVGGHETLKFVPGAALLGLAAQRLPASHDRWTVLHSGKVRFGNCLPSSEAGKIGYPVPASLKQPKEEASGSPVTYNTAISNAPKDLRIKDVGGHFVTTDVEAFRVELTDRLKTAVDAMRGSAATGQLFETQTLAAGQMFFGTLEADVGAFSSDHAVDERLFNELVALLASKPGKAARLGRSRSTEFGECLIALRDAEVVAATRPASGKVIVWALSDIALIDRHGQPSLSPAPADFGLTGGRLSGVFSAVKTRSIAPFNSYWGVNDSERHVIEAGSVMVFEGVTAGHLGQQRVGAFRQAGFGHVWIGPELLAAPQLVVHATQPKRQVGHNFGAPNSSLLFQWMNDRISRQNTEYAARSVVAKYVDILRDAYDSASRYSGRREDGLSGPSKTQWNEVASVARNARTTQVLNQELFGDNGIIKYEDRAWKTPVGAGQSFRQLMMIDVFTRLQKELNEDAPTAMALIAQRMAEYVSSGRRSPSGART
jgi:hypothetical protein